MAVRPPHRSAFGIAEDSVKRKVV
jgi:hypothetical protein